MLGKGLKEGIDKTPWGFYAWIAGLFVIALFIFWITVDPTGFWYRREMDINVGKINTPYTWFWITFVTIVYLAIGYGVGKSEGWPMFLNKAERERKKRIKALEQEYLEKQEMFKNKN